ncbi:Glutathione import ATP-binding protein GsiA [uncultured Clostridium sp.]|uniref:ATP-binding cassette domain-containing protein n=1 Tax=uncultured Clostridium sp. TaxID=59620 RepID=UPI000822AE32|nr:ABC transporter ATP-binding protein [uncultured Clostridium sp.]SCK04019.1 Glutathione import ATP-binding protein GsiA [uncultured Clostridium sp.]
MKNKKVLEIKRLKQYFRLNKNKIIKAIDDISIEIHEGEVLGLVGESGCGKSTLGKSIVGINKITSGEIIYKGIDISANRKLQKRIVSDNIQFIFQDSTSSLNSRMTIGEIIAEPLNIKKIYKDKKDRDKRVYEMMKLVGLDKDFINKYPYDFSGGQRQRVAIARALSINPEFIIADEPIASLDVSMQAQVINLFKELKNKGNFTCLFISHDLSMVRYISDRIAVIYNGKIVELAETEELYNNPIHPYTKSLLDSILIPDINSSSFEVIGSNVSEYKDYIKSGMKWEEIKKDHFVYM